MVLFQCCLAVSLLRGCSCKQLSSSSLVSSPSSTSCLLLTWTTLSASCPMPSPPATPASCTTSAMGVAMLRFDRTLQACCWSNRNWNLGSDCPLSGPRLPECSSPLAPNLRQHVGRIYRTPTPKDDRSGSFGEASFLFQGWHPPDYGLLHAFCTLMAPPGSCLLNHVDPKRRHRTPRPLQQVSRTGGGTNSTGHERN